MGTNNSEESIILVVLSLALNETGVPPFCLLVRHCLSEPVVLFNSLSVFFNRFTRAQSAVYKKGNDLA